VFLREKVSPEQLIPTPRRALFVGSGNSIIIEESRDSLNQRTIIAQRSIDNDASSGCCASSEAQASVTSARIWWCGISSAKQDHLRDPADPAQPDCITGSTHAGPVQLQLPDAADNPIGFVHDRLGWANDRLSASSASSPIIVRHICVPVWLVALGLLAS
jgi:hypothetical protein